MLKISTLISVLKEKLKKTTGAVNCSQLISKEMT